MDFSVPQNTNVLTEKTCTYPDGTRGCWRIEYTNLTRKTVGVPTGINTDPDSTVDLWMWMARPDAQETSGWRANAGEKMKFAMIAKQYTGAQ